MTEELWARCVWVVGKALASELDKLLRLHILLHVAQRQEREYWILRKQIYLLELLQQVQALEGRLTVGLASGLRLLVDSADVPDRGCGFLVVVNDLSVVDVKAVLDLSQF